MYICHFVSLRELHTHYPSSIMKIVSVLLILVFLVSCNKRVNNRGVNIETISVDNAHKDDLSFIDSIQIIPLETTDSTLVKGKQLFQYLEKPKLFLIFDANSTVFLFDHMGKSVSNSAHCYGEGPKQYPLIVDAEYDSYTNTINLLNPTRGGIIYRYDLHFNWIDQLFLNDKNGLFGRILSVIDKDLYAVTPILKKENDSQLGIYDLSVGNNPQSTVVAPPKDNFVVRMNMMQKVFTQTDTALCYTPKYMDYHFYRYDITKRHFSSIYRLDIGKDAFQKEDLYDRFGKGTSDNAWKSGNIIIDKDRYLLSSHYMLPITRLISDNYIYIRFACNRESYHFIYDRRSKESCLITPDADIRFYGGFCLKDNVIYTLAEAYEINKYINESCKRFMSDDMYRKLETIKEDDNGVIIAYHLKK